MKLETPAKRRAGVMLAIALGSVTPLASCASVDTRYSAPSAPVHPSATSVTQETGAAPQDGALGEQGIAPHPDPQPDEDGFDWIRLISDEWLKGEIKGLRDGSFEFESDELGTLKLDWDDVPEVRSSRTHMVLVKGRKTHIGKLSIKGDQVTLSGHSEQHLSRDDLMAIVPGEPSEWNYWSGSLSLGVTLRRGNTDQTDSTLYAAVKRETAATRWGTTYNGTIAEVNNEETANNHRLDSRFDWFLTNRLFVTPASFQYFRDPFQNIGHRLTPAAGLGYHVIDEDTMELSVLVGPAYQITRLDSTVPGQDDQDETAAAIASVGYSWDVTPDFEFGIDYSVTVPLPDSEDYNSHFSALIAVDLIGDFDLEVRFVWDRVNNPQEDADGNTPVQDDFRTTVGVGWEF